MNQQEFHIHIKVQLALSFIIAADDIAEESDEFDEVTDTLSRMSFEEFDLRYPLLHQKYYVEKSITTKHIQVSFHFPLLAKIKKLYYNELGFSLNEIATIIQKQYIKFYANPERYLPKGAYQLEDLSIRFSVMNVIDTVTYIYVGVDT